MKWYSIVFITLLIGGVVALVAIRQVCVAKQEKFEKSEEFFWDKENALQKEIAEYERLRKAEEAQWQKVGDAIKKYEQKKIS